MQRTKQTKLNIIVAVMHQLITAVSGLILPRFILLFYGSETNGLLQSISQLLSYTTLLECGIGGMVLAAFYKPLANNNAEAISDIFNNTKRFFKRISFIFICFVLVLCIGIKLIVSTEFGFFYTAALVLVLAVNTYFNYYFAMTHLLLLKADQKLYIIQLSQIITIVLNLAFSIILIMLGSSVHVVKLASALVFLINPIIYRRYVKKHYKISNKKETGNTPLPEKKDGVIHHVSYFIHRNTDIVILSAFCGVVSVSVYSVYNAVILMIENLLLSISSGITGAIGNMIARNEKHTLDASFDIYEGVNTFLTMAISTAAAILIVPFVRIYTGGINDAGYLQPVFSYFMIAATMMYCIRIPYGMVVGSAGHYKQTRFGAICEVVINLTLSLVLVVPFGLAGVAAGTFAAMAYRTFYTVRYLSKSILNRSVIRFIISFILNSCTGVAIVLLFNMHMPVFPVDLAGFFVDAVKVSVIVFPVFLILNFLIYIVSKRERYMIKK